jgi:hypothetical protein
VNEPRERPPWVDEETWAKAQEIADRRHAEEQAKNRKPRPTDDPPPWRKREPEFWWKRLDLSEDGAA